MLHCEAKWLVIFDEKVADLDCVSRVSWLSKIVNSDIGSNTLISLSESSSSTGYGDAINFFPVNSIMLLVLDHFSSRIDLSIKCIHKLPAG